MIRRLLLIGLLAGPVLTAGCQSGDTRTLRYVQPNGFHRIPQYGEHGDSPNRAATPTPQIPPPGSSVPPGEAG